MKRNIFRALIFMVIAVIGVGAVAASDIDCVDDNSTVTVYDGCFDDNSTVTVYDGCFDDNSSVVICYGDFKNNSHVVRYDGSSDDIDYNEPILVNIPVCVLYDEKTLIFNTYVEYMNKTGLLDEIQYYYMAGYTIENIAKEINSTKGIYIPSDLLEQVRDTFYPSIENKKCEAIFKLYGSYTLEEISQKVHLGECKVFQKICDIKNGLYGDYFKKILLNRDLFLMNNNCEKFIIK